MFFQTDTKYVIGAMIIPAEVESTIQLPNASKSTLTQMQVLLLNKKKSKYKKNVINIPLHKIKNDMGDLFY